MPETTIVQIAMQPGEEAVLCQLTDGRVFIALPDSIRKFAEQGDADALAAFRKAWVREPSLFAGPIRPRLPVAQVSSAAIAASQVQRIGPAANDAVELEHGFTGELTDRDRARLHKIIQKEHRRWFADWPTKAQMDNLIDGIGLRIAEQQVRRMVDQGRIA